MKKKNLLIAGLLLIIFPLLFLRSVSAAEWYILKEVSLECREEGNCQLIDFLRLARGVSLFLLGIIGVLALIFFIVGGIIWITSGGNPLRVKRGKQILIGTLFGLMIVFLSWYIVNIIICGLSKGQILQSCEIFGSKKWYVFPTTEEKKSE